ncbi:MAG: glycosyltransferase family 4 protein [Ruminiclostridium sp.]
MKKVLIIAHQFPPVGGSGVQRTLKFVKYLRSFGYEPIILTRDPSQAALKDETLLADIPCGIKILRTRAYDFAALQGVLKYLGKVLGRLLIPDAEVVWQYASRNKALEILKTNNIDVIYTTSTPYSDHLLGMYLKKHFPGVPLVCDFRDEWTNNPYHRRKWVRAIIERNLEKKVLLAADCLIANTPIMLANFLRDNPETKNKFYVIPNGYDEADFEGIKDIKPSNDKFTLTYTGLLYGKRKPDNFFEALKIAIDKERIDITKILIQLIGNFKAAQLQEKIDSYSLTDIVVALPYMEHRTCLIELLKSDALLLIEPSGPGAEAFYTGKVFEYMNTGRPILATIPHNGAAAQLIAHTSTGLVSDYNDIEGTAENLTHLYRCWVEHLQPLEPNKSEMLKYERKELTKSLVDVLNNSLKK